MLFVAFFQWWYGVGWAGTITETKRQLANLAGSFSLSILLRTLFAPWKQMDAQGGRGLQHFVDKFVSRFVGFCVRSITLLTAVVTLVGMTILRIIWILLWPCLPLSIVLLIAYGLGVIG